MKEPNDFFKALLSQAIDNWFKTDGNNDSNSGGDGKGSGGNFFGEEAAKKLFWYKIGIYLFLGASVLKVIFRTNFGVKAISLLQIGLASLILFIWALICFIFAMFDFGIDEIYYVGIFGGKIGLLISFLFYTILAFYIFSIGRKERALSKHNSKRVDVYYRGDSVFLSGLKNKGWTQKKIHELAEPLLAFSTSILLIAFNPMLGFPLFLCSISLVLHQIYENIFELGETKIKKILKNMGNQESDFSPVK